MEAFLEDQNLSPSIICLTEHWLSDPECNVVSVERYSAKSYFSRGGKGYGGSIIFTHQELIADSMPKLVALSSCKTCEISAIRVFCFDLVSLYRPPSGDFEFLRIIAKLLNCLNVKKTSFLGVT